MMDNHNHNDPAFAFMKLKKEVQGVEYVFIFPRQIKPQNPFEERVNQFVSGLSTHSPTKIFVYIVKGGIVVRVTTHFVIGCIINSDANPTLVEMILDRIVLNLDLSFQTFKTDIKLINKKIKQRIESLKTAAPVTVSLEATPFTVKGYITVTTTPKQKNQLQPAIERILAEEIPFFCSRDIALTVNARNCSATAVWVLGSTP